MNKKNSQHKIFNFDNTFVKLPKNFFQEIKPESVKKPELLKLNNQLSNYLNLKIDDLKSDLGISILSGNLVPAGSTPIAMVYAGHQFGNFVDQLGDGRAILLGEVISQSGKRYDIQLKGSGKTKFSRQGDGRSPLGPVVREYVISEAMHYLGIPTTRVLSMLKTGELVEREKIEPGGILARVSSSHIRIGTFEFFSAKKDFKSLKKLADYTIKRHFPEVLSSKKNKYSLFLDKVIISQAKLVAQWMNIGFIHGVMNTDNTSISGETIDYGPCAFMNSYDPMTVYSYIDIQGRYNYGNQPKIMFWNLSKFAESIAYLIDENEIVANKKILDSLKTFPDIFSKFWIKGIKNKIGLNLSFKEDIDLIESLLDMMYKQKSDFTITFRKLINILDDTNEETEPLLYYDDINLSDSWLKNWKLRLQKERESKKTILKKMNNFNPIFIPRNHLVEEAINKLVENNDLSLFNNLLDILKKPFSEKKNKVKFAKPPNKSQDIKNTFCGT